MPGGRAAGASSPRIPRFGADGKIQRAVAPLITILVCETRPIAVIPSAYDRTYVWGCSRSPRFSGRDPPGLRRTPAHSDRCPAILSASRDWTPKVMTEAAVRHSLREQMLARAPSTAEAIYEFWVPRSHERADVAVIDGGIDGFEIKTERDTLKRLPRQAEAYTRIFDRCHVVLAHRHLDKAMEMLPAWWGVLVIGIDSEPSFTLVREAGTNNGVDPEILVRLLWRDEVHAALCHLGAPPEVGVGRSRMWNQLLALLDLDSLKAIVRESLLRRDSTRARIPSQRFAVSWAAGSDR